MITNYDLEEYADPEIYDLENQGFEPDGLFLLDYAKKLAGPVLELGCGTGRVTIPMAQDNIDITGLDLVPGMIERARQKAGDLPIQWVIDDARTFQLEQTFRLIFETGSVFQHLLTRPDQEAYLARVREHLEDDGLFIIAVMFPQPDLFDAVETEKVWFTYKSPTGREIRVSGTEFYDPIRQVKLETAYRRWTDENGQEILKVAPLSLRFVFPQEMEALLHYNGFKILERYGDWDSSPLTGESTLMVLVCGKQKNAGG
jgi:SAM-dependent methyltransferase